MVVSQTLRQGGHFFVEGNVSANEKLKIGQRIKVKELAKQPMNGREIKNAIRLALALSKQANDKQLSMNI